VTLAIQLRSKYESKHIIKRNVTKLLRRAESGLGEALICDEVEAPIKFYRMKCMLVY
jgi:hypothetical protein